MPPKISLDEMTDKQLKSLITKATKELVIREKVGGSAPGKERVVHSHAHSHTKAGLARHPH